MWKFGYDLLTPQMKFLVILSCWCMGYIYTTVYLSLLWCSDVDFQQKCSMPKNVTWTCMELNETQATKFEQLPGKAKKRHCIFHMMFML